MPPPPHYADIDTVKTVRTYATRIDDTRIDETEGSRMHEFRIKCGSSKGGGVPEGRIQRIYNKQITKTITTYTLPHLLGEKVFSCIRNAIVSFTHLIHYSGYRVR